MLRASHSCPCAVAATIDDSLQVNDNFRVQKDIQDPNHGRNASPEDDIEAMTCLGSATVSPGLSTTLLDHVANQAHYRLGLVRICPLGHIHGGGSRGAPGLLLQVSLAYGAALPAVSGCPLSSSLETLIAHPRNLLPPLAAVWYHSSSLISVHRNSFPATHLAFTFGHQIFSVQLLRCTLTLKLARFPLSLPRVAPYVPFSGLSPFTTAINSNTERKPFFARSSPHFLASL